MAISTELSGKKDSAMADLEQRILDRHEVRDVLNKLAPNSSNPLKAAIRMGRRRGSDAMRASWEKKAAVFAESVSSTREPFFVSRNNEQAALFVQDSFSKVHVAGLDGIVAGCLREGRVIVFRNHQSYAGVVLDWDVYARSGIQNMTFIAGSNIVDMADKGTAAVWRERLTRTGVKLVEREPPTGKDGLLYFTVLGASIALDLSEGSSITIYGNGREKGSAESSLKTALISFFLKHSQFILPVAESYEVIPDDSELANVGGPKKKGRGASFDSLLKLKRMPEFGEAPYGEAYLNFGVPFQTSEYGQDKQSMRRCEAEARERATQLVTLSSTYLLAAAVRNSGLVEFDVGKATGLVRSLLEKIFERNANYVADSVRTRVFIAPKLAEGSLPDVVLDAAEKLASRGALVKNGGAYSVGDAVMLDFYSAKGEAPLRAHGIPLEGKKA